MPDESPQEAESFAPLHGKEREVLYRQQIQAVRAFSNRKPFLWLVCAPTRQMFEDILRDLAHQCGGDFKFVSIPSDCDGIDPTNTGFIEIADGSLPKTRGSAGSPADGVEFNHAWGYAFGRCRRVNPHVPYLEIEG